MTFGITMSIKQFSWIKISSQLQQTAVLTMKLVELLDRNGRMNEHKQLLNRK